MKPQSFFVSLAAASSVTISAAASPYQHLATRLRGRSNVTSDRSRSLTGGTDSIPPFYFTVVVDLQGMSASGFSCSLQGYSVAPGNTWNGINCTLGCEGTCGLISFQVQPDSTSGDPTRYFLEGLDPINYFPYAPVQDDINGPNDMFFSATMNITIPQTTETTSELSGLRIGYGDSGTLDWWVGSSLCVQHGSSREMLSCNGGHLKLSTICDEHYYTDDALASGFDVCVQLSAAP